MSKYTAVFTFHGVFLRIDMESDEHRARVVEAAELLAARLGATYLYLDDHQP